MKYKKKILNYPHFICIGPPKSASTWVSDHLKFNKDIWLPPIQELNYLFTGFYNFEGKNLMEYKYDPWSILKRIVRNKSIFSNSDKKFYKLAKKLTKIDPKGVNFNDYKKLFSIEEGKITGDISPMYSSFNLNQIKRLKKVLNTKIFMIVRNPVDRFISDLRHIEKYKVLGDIDYFSEKNIKNFLYNKKIVVDTFQRHKVFYPSEIYKKWKKVWGNNFKCFFFDDIKSNPKLTLKKIINYIGADNSKRISLIPVSINRNKAKKNYQIDTSSLRRIHKHFLPELKKCDKLFYGKGKKWLINSHNILKN